jgi:tellurite methyltransferase
LAENELLRLFSELRVLAYREEGRVGNMAEGFRNEAMIVAQKR